MAEKTVDNKNNNLRELLLNKFPNDKIIIDAALKKVNKK
jgi:hypothetical protein